MFRVKLLTLLVMFLTITGLLFISGSRHTLYADDHILIENDFEDGTTQGWGPRGDAIVEASTEDANSGTYSLKTTGRTQGWHGPSQNVLGMMQPGGIYEVSGYVKLVAGQTPSQIIIAMQRTPSGGDTSYDWIAPSADAGVTDAGWVFLQGQYSFADPVSELILYAESSNAETEFYLDDLTISEVTPPPPTSGGIVLETDFEDGSAQGWGPRGDAAVTAVTTTAQSGSYSLEVTGRTDGWNGTQYNVQGLLLPDTTYSVSGHVRLVEGQVLDSGTRIMISMQRTPVDGDTSYEWVAPSAPDAITDSEWTNLQAQYSYSGDVSELILYIESSDPDVEFYLDNVVITGQAQLPIQTDIPSVYETLANEFIVGAALEPDQLDSQRHADLLTMHFNSITAENAMKPESIQPTEGNFTWDNADRLVEFANDNNMYIHGHTLVWHEQAAQWMFLDASGEPMEPTPENKALLLQRMEDHIRATVSRYEDDINVWDVVNEAIDPGQENCMRESIWYQIAGVDFIKTAFEVAREEAPDAVLLLNDFGTTSPQKRQCLYDLASSLIAEGVPIDGIGMQQHNNIQNPSIADIEATIELFASLGVEVHITELDVSIYTSGSDAYLTEADVPENVLITQGHRFKELFEMFRRQSDNIGSITFWGIADDHTWLTNRPITRVDLPMMFDQQLQAKYAYWGVVDPSVLPVPIQEMTIFQDAPMVDGQTELAWEMLPSTHIEASETFAADFQTRWDDDKLYVLVEVTDRSRDMNDSVEIFIDGNNDKSDTYGDDDQHQTFTYGNRVGDNFVVRPTGHGYRLEAVFALDETAVIGDQIGFDIRVTNARDADNPISWNDITHTQDNDTSRFGVLNLAEAMKLTIAGYASTPPTIDGAPDAIWGRAVAVSTDVLVEGSIGATASVKALWDEEYLYVYAVISDELLSKESSNAWEEDSLEIFVDQNNGKTISYEPDDGQYRINFDNEQSFGGVGASADKITSATQIIDGGYIVEAAIALDAIDPQHGTFIGYDAQVNDDDVGDGTRSGVMMWHDPTGQGYQNTSRLGVLMLVNTSR